MTLPDGRTRQFIQRRLFVTGFLVTAVCICFFAAGCATMKQEPVEAMPAEEKPSGKAPEVGQDQAAFDEQAREIERLKARNKELDLQVRKLNSRSKAEKVARESLARRLEAAQAAREEAIREVVRVRARIQGMASSAEASAMFAEARVILDRMEEEAYSAQALEDLSQARSYMARGKGALDTGNPGGAAYLFDLIPSIYESMKKSEPRAVKVNVSVAALRKSPSSSSGKIASLYWGETVTGVSKGPEWIKVRTSSGQTGWLMWSQVQ